MKTCKRIYVAGPYTIGDVAINVRNAVEAADRLLALGFAPYIPHLTHFWHLISPHEYETWLLLDLEWLRTCHAVLRLPGESRGADREVDVAINHGIPVFENIKEIQEHYPYIDSI